MQELEGKISESKKSKLKIERELNDSELIASYKSALRIRTELEPHFALISQILKSLDDISKISEAIDKMQSINDIKRWYEKEFIDRYINKLLESKNSPIINNINKYNFYYYYLLLFLSTYSNEYNKENSDTLICIDECQDLSINELRLVEEVNPEASINLFGDINQRLTPKGASSLEDYPSNYTSYMLKNNYRNTYEITSFYNKNLIMDDIPVGVNGPEVLNCSLGDLSESFQNANSVFICTKKEYSFLVKMKIPIKVMIIEDAKGLEFHTVCVYDKNMTKNEKYIAYSRALYQLIRITSLNVERE
jgi:DNA helicase IV